jgi:hypothetical protein
MRPLADLLITSEGDGVCGYPPKPLIRELPGQGPPNIAISVARRWHPNVANEDTFADRQSGTRFGCPPVNSEIIAPKLAIVADACRLERSNALQTPGQHHDANTLTLRGRPHTAREMISAQFRWLDRRMPRPSRTAPLLVGLLGFGIGSPLPIARGRTGRWKRSRWVGLKTLEGFQSVSAARSSEMSSE